MLPRSASEDRHRFRMDNTEIRVRDYAHIVFFTGAGLSAESGIPTYRGKGGVWKEYDFEQYACQAAFDRDPEAVWEFHNFRRNLISQCTYNAAHKWIAQCQATLPDVTIVTQNIDGMHQLAGATRVHELHGSIWRTRCDYCGAVTDDRSVPCRSTRCTTCTNSYMRPDIVWFGDPLHERVIAEAVSAIERCDLLVSIGTSGVVYPAAQMPMHAKQTGATLVEVNPESTVVSRFFDVKLRMKATEALELLCEGVQPPLS
jgi:NAD-dependent deacetylase